MTSDTFDSFAQHAGVGEDYSGSTRAMSFSAESSPVLHPAPDEDGNASSKDDGGTATDDVIVDGVSSAIGSSPIQGDTREEL